MPLNPPVQVGELTDVPASGSGVKSAFHQEVANRIMGRFATVAARTSAWAASVALPAKGTPSYLATSDATEGPEFWNGTAWRKPWNMPWGRLAVGAQSDVNITTTTYQGSAIGPITFLNRLYRFTVDVVGSYGSIAGDSWNIGFGEVGQAVAGSQPFATQLANVYWQTGAVNFYFSPAAGSRSFDLRAWRASGTGALQFRARLVLYDEGPLGAPA